MIHIDFSIDAEAKAALDKSVSTTSIGAILITAEKEQLKLLAPPLNSSGNIDEDMKSVRKVLTEKGSTAAYIVLRTSPTQQAVLVYVSDAAPAKDRMIYSSGSHRIVGATPQAQKATVQVSSIAEIVPSLLSGLTQGQRDDLMTESERNKAAIARMELAPQPVALPGISIQMSSEADALLVDFAKGSIDAITFKIEKERLELDQSAGRGSGGIEAIKDLLPEGQPRFVVMRYTPPKSTRHAFVMVYVCPPTCSPKVKIHYASSAAAFREHAAQRNIRFEHRVETDTRETLQEDVQSAFEAYPVGEEKPRAPAPAVAKGPRMLI